MCWDDRGPLGALSGRAEGTARSSVHGWQPGTTNAGWYGPRSPSPPHWTVSQSAQRPQGLPLPERPWLEGRRAVGEGRARLLVKFSVRGGAAAQGPPATRLPLGPAARGRAGLAPPGAGPLLACALDWRPDGQACAQGVRSGCAADRCEVRGHACAPRCPLSGWQGQGSPLATAPLEGWLRPSSAGSWGQPAGQGVGRWGSAGLSWLVSYSHHQSGAAGKWSSGHAACGVAPRAAPGWPGGRASPNTPVQRPPAGLMRPKGQRGGGGRMETPPPTPQAP